jgi:predicted RNA-binding Zn ribbon-like protein
VASMTPTEKRLPHDLDLLIDFVNTVEPEVGTDSIATPARLRAWLTQWQLLSPDAPSPTRGEHTRAIDLREALRAMMLANNGGPRDPRAATEVDQAARRGRLSVRFAHDGSVSLGPCGTGFDDALASLLVPLAWASLDGSWRRVKACRQSICREAFYDHSRNLSGVWCDMALCGNRTKVRSYRARAREQTARH